MGKGTIFLRILQILLCVLESGVCCVIMTEAPRAFYSNHVKYQHSFSLNKSNNSSYSEDNTEAFTNKWADAVDPKWCYVLTIYGGYREAQKQSISWC